MGRLIPNQLSSRSLIKETSVAAPLEDLGARPQCGFGPPAGTVSFPQRQTLRIMARGYKCKHTSLACSPYKRRSASFMVRSPPGDCLRQKALDAASGQAILSHDGGAGSSDGGRGDSGWGGGGGDDGSEAEPENPSNIFSGVAGMLSRGWRERVEADPEFVFKVLTEQIIGVTTCVLGDMASRPNFGLNELDFVFSTLVVGSILNFALMYMLAPVVSSSAVARLPGIFSASPVGHMFEPGTYTLAQRAGTFVYKGIQFGFVGFAAGLVGTMISTLLLEFRKRLQPGFRLQNEPPPTFLNAATWGLHVGISSNLRYQALNGLDLILARNLSPSVFKGLVFCIRALNNVVGGSTFALLAKATGSQKSSAASASSISEPASVTKPSCCCSKTARNDSQSEITAQVPASA